MFYTLSASKPHKKRAQIHPKTPPKFEIKSGHTLSKCTKITKKNEEREREITSWSAADRRGRERKRGGGRTEEWVLERERVSV